MRKALIVIDVQKFFLNKETERIVKKIQKFLKNNYRKYSLVNFTIFRNDPTSPLWNISGWKKCTKSPDTDLFDELVEFTTKNNVFYKNIFSAAKVVQIREELKKHNVLEVDICGFDTDCCVLATAYDLFDLNIKPVILENLIWSTSKDKLHKSSIQIIKRNIGFLKK